MCRTCGCDSDEHTPASGTSLAAPHPAVRRAISIETGVLDKNDRLAGRLRDRFERAGVTVLNLIGSPGAGKTTLLERTIRVFASDVAIGVLEGDQATDCDAKRIAATGAPVVQINTGAGCHLDAAMIDRGVAELGPAPGTLLFVENVGNLVCPALFDLGERAKIVVLALTEGEDKPLKYPHVFRAASAVVVTKLDLAPYLDIDLGRYVANARQINPAIEVFAVSATRGDGMADWCAWLRAQLAYFEAPITDRVDRAELGEVAP